jgi:predicted protein tyrosine phosphatase
MGVLVKAITRGPGILYQRVRSHGIGVTLLWMYARAVPAITGVPMLRYSEVTPQIFVGPQFRKNGRRMLEQAGITNSINLRLEYDDAARGLALAGHCYLPTVDDAAPSLEHLAEGVRFIEEVVSRGEKVYIHCAGGVGRAPTMAAAYLVTQGMAADEAYACVIRARPFINPTRVQTSQLELFAQHWQQIQNSG